MEKKKKTPPPRIKSGVRAGEGVGTTPSGPNGG